MVKLSMFVHLEVMKLKNDELDWLAQKLNEHIEGSLMTLDDIVFYYGRLENFVLYDGVAYRVIYHSTHEDINLSISANKCFSKSEQALYLFIENQKFHNGILPYKRYKSQVKGIDVNALIVSLRKKGYDIVNKFIFEEEILVVDIDKMEEI